MVGRIQTLFKKHKVFAAYITVGEYGLDDSVAVADAFIGGGVNLLELGVPFSDPIADGPVIQRAAQRALKNNVSLFDVLAVAKKLRKDHADIPLVLFGYLNPFLHADPAQWLPKVKAAGIDGILVVDLPYEESDRFYRQCLAHDINLIFIITPVTTAARLKKIVSRGQGFLYYASQKGTTGVRVGLPATFAQQLAVIKAATTLPILVGFGVASMADAKAIWSCADGFVFGSFFIKALEQGASLTELTQLARQFIAQ